MKKTANFLLFLSLAAALAACGQAPSMANATGNSDISMSFSNSQVKENGPGASHKNALENSTGGAAAEGAFQDGERYIRLQLSPPAANGLDFSGSSAASAGVVLNDETLFYTDGTSVLQSALHLGSVKAVCAPGLTIRNILAADENTVYFSVDPGDEASQYGAFWLYAFDVKSGALQNKNAELGLPNRSLSRVMLFEDNFYVATQGWMENPPELIWMGSKGVSQVVTRDFSGFFASGASLFYQNDGVIFYKADMDAEALPVYEIQGYKDFAIYNGYLYLFTQSPQKATCTILHAKTLEPVEKLELGENSFFTLNSGLLAGVQAKYAQQTGTVPLYNNFKVDVYTPGGAPLYRYTNLTLSQPTEQLRWQIAGSAIFYQDGDKLQTRDYSNEN